MRLTIQWKIIIAFLVVALVSIIGVMLVSMTLTRSRLRSDVITHFGEMAEDQYYSVSRVMDRGRSDSLLMAGNSILASNAAPDAKRAELSAMKEILNEYEDITLIDLAGEVVTSTDYNIRGNWKDRGAFEAALGGKNSVSNVYATTDPFIVVITFTAPVMDASGAVKSVVALQLNAQVLWDVTDQMRVGDTGYVYLIDEFDRYIAYHDKSLILYQANPEVLAEMNSGKSLLDYPDEDGKRMVGVYYQRSGEGLEEQAVPEGWRVLVVQEEQEAFLLLNRMQFRIVLFSLIILLGAILLGLLFSRSLARPIRQLTQGAESLTKGDLDYRVMVKSNDEIGRLADTFNLMAEAVSEDIAERQKAVQALSESEELYRRLVAASPDAIVLADLEVKVVFANQSAAGMFRYASPQQMEGVNFMEIIEEEGVERAFRMQRELQDKDVLRDIEFKMRRRDGEVFPADVSATLVFDSEMRPRGYIGVIRDITQRKAVEEALRTSEEKYRAVFEATGTAMCTLDAEGAIYFANQEFVGVTGLSMKTIAGKKRLADMLLKEDRESFEQSLEEALRGPAQVPLRFPMHIVKRSGEEVFVLGNMARVPGTDTVVISLVDVTRERIYERTLEERTKQLRDFLSIASHELRHPITLIKGYLELLAEELNEEEPSESVLLSLRRVQTSTDRLILLGDELMDASRIEQGSFLLIKTRLKLEELIEHAVAEMEMRDIDVAFEARLNGGCRDIEADREKVYRLLVILLENAAKFSPPQGLVEVEMEERGGEQLVSVLDRGIGVPDNERLKIFDRFYQVEDVLHHSIGMGLGLYIATEIVEAHGGRIWCISRPGGGSVFGFSLPCPGAKAEAAS